MDKKPLIGVSICAVFLLVLGSLTNVVGYKPIKYTMNNQDPENHNSEKNILNTTIIRYCFICINVEGGVHDYDYYLGHNFHFVLYGPFKVFRVFPPKIYTFSGYVDGLISGLHGLIGWGKTGYGLYVTIWGFARYFEGTQSEI